LGVAGYIARRLLLLIPVIIGVTFITFLISFVFTPDVARAWAGLRASQATLQALALRYHLNDPIYVQYYYYMINLLTGNWGTVPSSGKPVIAEVGLFFPATLELALAAIFITIVIGIPLGVIAAMYYGRKADHAVRLIYLTGYSSPPFFVALLVVYVFGYVLNIFPTQGELSSSLAFPTRITGMVIVDSLLTANWPDFVDAVWHIILPATALALIYFGIVTRVTRASMLEVLQKDFIRTSYAKGLRRRTIIIRHALRNALIPTTTVLGLVLGSMLGGAIVIETIFQWPGIGLYATQSIESYDFPAIIGVTVLFALGVVIANLIADIIYAVLDPRIKV
jgi:ABC-type dipeptide/oligopeptide/nickel transport system permease component